MHEKITTLDWEMNYKKKKLKKTKLKTNNCKNLHMVLKNSCSHHQGYKDNRVYDTLGSPKRNSTLIGINIFFD